MHDDGRSTLREALLRRRTKTTAAWAEALSSLADDHSDRADFGELVDQAIAFLSDETQGIAAAEAIGRMVESVDARQPEALGRSLEVLVRELQAGLAPDSAILLQPRLASLLGGIAGGYARAVRDTLLAGQAAIQDALQSDREGVERALRASETRYKQLIDLLPVGFLAAAPETGQILLANQLALSMLADGSATEVIGRSTSDFVHVGYQNLLRAYDARMTPQNPLLDLSEETLVLPDGSTRTFEFAARLLFEIEEPIVQIVFHDITERKRAEAALRESESLFRTLAETTQSAIFMYRQDRNIYVNQAACDITGYTRHEILTMPFWELIRSDFRAIVRQRGMARQRGEPVDTHYEVPILAKDGTTRWLQFAGNVIDYQGERAVLGMAIDVTTHKLAQDALKDSEQKFRTLAEVTPAGILIISGDEPVYVNPGFETLTGYSLDELRTIDVFKLLAPESLLKLRGTIDAFRRELQSDPIELKIRTKSNELKWMSASWHQIELCGEPAWITTVYDITPRVEAAEKFRTYAKRLELLSEIDRAGLLAQSKQEIASAALRMITEFIPCDRTSIAEVDSVHHVMRILAVAPQRQTRIGSGRRFQLDNWQKIAEAQKEGISYVPDLDRVPARTPLQEEIHAEGLRSYVSAALSSKGRLIGMLNLGSFRPNAFSTQDHEIIREVAQRVAVVLRNAQLFAELESSRQRLGELSRQLVLVQETERRYLARELHDEIGQTLTALGISLELAKHATDDSWSDRIVETQQRVEDLSQRVRQLSLNLRPPMLDDLGLLPTLLWYFDRCAQQYHIEVEFEQQGMQRSFGSEIDIVVYRIVQEALTNIARHVGAGSAVVRLWADSTTLSVQVEDRGRGFNVDEVLGRSTSSGLSGIRERVRLVGGQLIVDSHPDTGTCLTALIPLTGRTE